MRVRTESSVNRTAGGDSVGGTAAAVRRQPLVPVLPRNGKLRPLGLDNVTIEGGFWHELQTRNTSATIPHILSWLDRAGWLHNFVLTRDGTAGHGRRGRLFADSEVYKTLETLAWDIGRTG